MPLLIWLVITPILTAVFLPLISWGISAKHLKRVAIILSLIPLAFLLVNHSQWIGTAINLPWFDPLAIHFYLKVDAISLLFLYLTALIVPISLASIRRHQYTFPVTTFYSLICLLQGLLFIFFTARDLAIFTIFWESIILPLYLIILFYGGQKRQTAALKFLIYMIAGSSLMVFAVLGIYFASANGAQEATFNMDQLSHLPESVPFYAFIGAIFLLAFAVKAPLFPFHAWLPDAYTEAPTAGSILLAGILSKAGIYGILRIGFEIFPSLIQTWSFYLLTLAILGVFYGALAAWQQSDFKKLIAYSSFSHVNIILVGLFVWINEAHLGAVLQAFNHGITITGLFLVVGWLETRVGTTSMKQLSGLAEYLPRLCWLTFIFILSSIALPGTNNFVGELLIFFGLFSLDPWIAAVLSLIIVLSVIYMLRFMQKVYFGKSLAPQDSWIDIQTKHLLVALPLVALIFFVGIYPMPLLKELQTLTETTIQETP